MKAKISIPAAGNFAACFAALVICLFAAAGANYAQSTSQDFPTPVTSGEISGTINPRDIGDSRTTSYFYALEASQGDLFVNLVTRNLNGSIDIFTMSGLQPLTKVTTYADYSDSETGRVIYLRKPEKLLLRVTGRTPGDEPATFRIKFAGSFVASADVMPQQPELPKVSAESDTGIRVNSVGTIIEVIPRAKPAETAVAEKTPPVEKAQEPEASTAVPAVAEPAETSEPAPTIAAAEPEKKVEVVKEDLLAAPAEKAEKTAEPARRTRTRRAAKKVETARSEPKEPPAADPMAGIHLVILFKDGKRIERVMSEVFRFSVDRGTLTVVSKDGSIGRYPMLDVAKVTIE